MNGRRPRARCKESQADSLLNPRSAAHRILSEVRRGGFADESAEAILPEVAQKDRGLALEIGYGCVRLRTRLDTWIQAFSDRPIRRVDADMLDWLRIGAYQLRELRTPDHASVNETVQAAREVMDRSRAAYINAVLRALASNANTDPFPSHDTNPIAYLTTWGSHPEWLIRRWLDRWSFHDVSRLVEHGNGAPEVVLRMLSDDPKCIPEGVKLRRLPDWPRSFAIVEGSPSTALGGLRGVIQDPAASSVVDYTGTCMPKPVIDVCAAPGTKAIGLAAAVSAPVVALDVSPKRLRQVGRSAERTHLPIALVAADARCLPIASAGTIIADVPCTGTGVLRRRVDSRWRLDEGRLKKLLVLQRDILESCSSIVKEGGVLVYSTCSLEPEENEDQVEAFLERHREFRREPPSETVVPETCLSAAGDLFVRPWITGTDGSYAARMRRTA